jgi:hypothetical protein
MLVSKVGSELRAGCGKGKATLGLTADQETLVGVGVELVLGQELGRRQRSHDYGRWAAAAWTYLYWGTGQQ